MVYHAGVKIGYSTFCPSCYADCGKRAITDSAGNFIIKNLSPDLHFEVLAVRDGYFAKSIKRIDPSKGPMADIILQARPPVNDPARVVRGRVVDPHGRPLRDAVVQPQAILYNDEKYGHIASYGTIAGLDVIAVTNDKGEFEISYSRPALKVLLLVEARGYAPKLFNKLPMGLDYQTLTVTDGATVRGRLIRNGKPMAGAEIGLIPRQRMGGAELELKGSLYSEMRIGTQNDGTFSFTNVPQPVEWYVYGKMESIAKLGATASVECSTKADNEDINLGDLQILPAHRLQGKVVLNDGDAIPEFSRIIIGPEDTMDSQIAMLQPDGTFEFAGLPSGKYSIFASVRGYQAKRKEGGMPMESLQIDRDITGYVLSLDRVQ
jgi:hypothetical protein